MGVVFKCDHCGKSEPATRSGRSWKKPYGWFQDNPFFEDPIIACSAECLCEVIEQRNSWRKHHGPLFSNESVIPLTDEHLARRILKESGMKVTPDSLNAVLSRPDVLHLKRLQLTLDCITSQRRQARSGAGG